jgi:hypothetical protein
MRAAGSALVAARLTLKLQRLRAETAGPAFGTSLQHAGMWIALGDAACDLSRSICYCIDFCIFISL